MKNVRVISFLLALLTLALPIAFSSCAPASNPADSDSGDVSSTDDSVSGSGTSDAATSEDPGEDPDSEPSPLIPAIADELSATMPVLGEVKALAIYVEFPNKTYNSAQAYSVDDLREELFGEGKSRVPYESVTAWFKRASYGNMTVTGDVFYYTCENPIEYYENGNYEDLVIEVLRGLDDEIDYSEFDSNGDGIIDNVSFTVPLDGASAERLDYWYGKTMTFYEHPRFRVDGQQLVNYIIMDVMPYKNDMVYLKQTLIHEMGHCMGLPDYYKYESSDWEGLHGSAGLERMDDSAGDFCGFSKLVYGWLREDQIQYYDKNGEDEQSFVLKSMSAEGSCLILPIREMDGLKSEYFLVEFVTPVNNNRDLTSQSDASGVRVFHVQAEIAEMAWNSVEFKYNNYSQYYKGDDGIRVLRLVNDGGGFYHTGDVVEYGAKYFEAYNYRTGRTSDPGYKITIGEIGKGEITVTVTK